MLKTTGLPNEPAPSKNNSSKLASSRNNNSKPASRRNDGDGKVDEFGDNSTEYAKESRKSKGKDLSKSQKLAKSGKNSSKSWNLPNFDATEFGPSFLTPKARSTFNHLWLAFTKAPILQHFDPKYHIYIKTDVLGYTIGGVLSQLTFATSPYEIVIKTDLSQWHPIAFFSRKMILVETQYKTHNGKLLAIIEAFKTWRHYLEGYKHEVLVLTDHNNFRRFMDTKSLSSRQVHWAQKLSWYYF